MREESSNTVKVYYPELSQDELIERIRKGAETISKTLPLRTITLFGSYAERRHTAASDIDILITYEGPRREDDYGLCWDALKLPQLELHIYTVSEYEEQRSLGSSLIGEAQKKGIIVWQSH